MAKDNRDRSDRLRYSPEEKQQRRLLNKQLAEAKATLEQYERDPESVPVTNRDRAARFIRSTYPNLIAPIEAAAVARRDAKAEADIEKRSQAHLQEAMRQFSVEQAPDPATLDPEFVKPQKDDSDEIRAAKTHLKFTLRCCADRKGNMPSWATSPDSVCQTLYYKTFEECLEDSIDVSDERGIPLEDACFTGFKPRKRTKVELEAAAAQGDLNANLDLQDFKAQESQIMGLLNNVSRNWTPADENTRQRMDYYCPKWQQILIQRFERRPIADYEENKNIPLLTGDHHIFKLPDGFRFYADGKAVNSATAPDTMFDIPAAYPAGYEICSNDLKGYFLRLGENGSWFWDRRDAHAPRR